MKFQVATPHHTAIVGDGGLGNEQRTLLDGPLDQSSFVDTAPDADSPNRNKPHGIGLADGNQLRALATKMGHSMQLRNNAEGQSALKEIVCDYYKNNGARKALNFLDTEDNEFFYAHFLIESRSVIRYSLGMDRRIWLGGVSLAIGPHYFPLRSLLNEEDADRLMIEASVQAIQNNLAILDIILLKG